MVIGELTYRCLISGYYPLTQLACSALIVGGPNHESALVTRNRLRLRVSSVTVQDLLTEGFIYKELYNI